MIDEGNIPSIQYYRDPQGASAKFKPLIFFVSGFFLPCATNIFFLTVLHYFCLLPAQLFYNYIQTKG
jgi:hypothetical protein